jgi:hypothetical protein
MHNRYCHTWNRQPQTNKILTTKIRNLQCITEENETLGDAFIKKNSNNTNKAILTSQFTL